MNNRIFLPGFLFAALLGLMACGGVDSPEKKPVAPAAVYMEREYHFSGTEEPDRFMLGYSGNGPAGNQLHFFIISYTGDTIFKKQFVAENLLSDSLAALPDSARNRELGARMQWVMELPGDSAFRILHDTLYQSLGKDARGIVFCLPVKNDTNWIWWSVSQDKLLKQ